MPLQKLVPDQELGEFEDETLRLLESGNLSVKLPEKLRKYFLEYEINHRQQRYYYLGIIFLILYDLFCINDYIVLSDIYKTAWFIRLCIVTPIFIVDLLMIKSKRFRNIIDALAAFVVVLVCLSIVIIYGLSSHPDHIHYHTGIILVIIFGNILIRINFRYAVASSFIVLIIFSVTSPYLLQVTHEVYINNVLVLFFAIVISLAGNHELGREHRRNILFNLLLHIKSKKLEDSNRRLTELSISDALTGLANRRYFDDKIRQEWRANLRTRLPISLIFIDIDYFKSYNDNYGHQTGDQCLTLIANELAHFARRPRDLCARYGGDEFVVLLPEIVQSEAAEIAEKIRQRILGLEIRHNFSETAPFITISLGVAELTPSLDNDSSLLIRTADNALYLAKARGRNRVACNEK
jgi:diguanylate cyclase (GGDEF)-like protein